MNSYVYLMQVPSGLVKIGVSKNLKGRLSQIQNGCPEQVRIIETCHGDRRFERLLHARYAKFCVRGEWFKLDQKQINDLETELRIKAGFPSIDWSTVEDDESYPWSLVTDMLNRFNLISVYRLLPHCKLLSKMDLEPKSIIQLASACDSYRHFCFVVEALCIGHYTGDLP